VLAGEGDVWATGEEPPCWTVRLVRFWAEIPSSSLSFIKNLSGSFETQSKHGHCIGLHKQQV
jgi:hypothetical protein